MAGLSRAVARFGKGRRDHHRANGPSRDARNREKPIADLVRAETGLCGLLAIKQITQHGRREERRSAGLRTSLPPDGIRKTLSTASFENPINTRAGFSLLPRSLGQIEMPDVEQARGVVREGQHGLADGGKLNPRASASRWAARMGCGAI